MPRIKQETVYQFDELDDSAKERAREWFRQGNLDYEWWDCTFQDAKECLKLAGFRIDKIYFSGFSSQGDGACFEGSWSAADAQPVKAMKEHAPRDKTLHEIAATMRDLARKHRSADPTLAMSVKHRGHYHHEMCTEFSVDAPDQETEDAIVECSRDAMRWIYRQLEKEYEYQNSDEVVDETICANQYEFSADGKRA